ncbi:MAG: hypothetical protein AB2L17_02770 [Lentimicrobium sp.]
MNRIILSRKGYDDQYGGKPSVILPDGTMLSFPIPVKPEKEDGIASGKLTFHGKKLSEYFAELGHKETELMHHVDPDIYGLAGLKKMGAFGQCGAALSHLKEVGAGDIFLFFGTFCFTWEENGKLRYEPMHPFHAIYGYMKVDKKVTINEIDKADEYSWLKAHPHYINQARGDCSNNNVIFIGKESGYFRYTPFLQLTKPGYHKSYWQLPVAFKGVEMSYHKPGNQKVNGDFIEFTSVAKGQEFVLSRDPELEKWIIKVLNHKIDQ